MEPVEFKRYLLFAGQRYYPGGGWNDYRGSFETADLAIRHIAKRDVDTYDWWQVVDLETGRVVEEEYG